MSSHSSVYRPLFHRKAVLGLGLFLVALGLWYLPAPAGLRPEAWRLFVVFFATILSIVTGLLPILVASIFALSVTVLTQLLTPEQAYDGFSQPFILLIVAAFLVSQAVVKSGLGKRIALHIIAKFGHSSLGLAYSNEASLRDAITHRRGTYWSRSRNALWVKGATSGATQQLLGVRLDCDRDCLRFQVTQDAPGFCHLKTHTCFGSERSIEAVVQRLGERIASTDAKSFTRKLVRDPEMLRAKLLEEAQELSEAESEDEITWEAADVLYFTLVKMVGHGVPLEAVYHELARRMNRVVRRKNKLEKNDANENSPSNRPENH